MVTSSFSGHFQYIIYSSGQSPWYKLPKDCSLLLSPTSERRCSKMMINHGFFSRYCINLLRKWILYIKIFVCQGRCYNFKPLTCSMSPGPNCPVCPTPYSSTNAFQSLGNLYEGLWIFASISSNEKHKKHFYIKSEKIAQKSQKKFS